jgi:hypothetical protein
MHEELVAALEPVRRDLRAGCAVAPDIREGSSEHYGDVLAGADFYGPDGSGQGVSVLLGGDDSHPLTARVTNGRAAWFCPPTGELVAWIGELPVLPPEASRRRP